jgi:thioredoxin-related protein
MAMAGATTQAATAKWEDNAKKGLEQAKTEKKPALLNFTGSDWCGWCVKLKKEVFDTKEFKEWAQKRVVLIEVDFPEGKYQSSKTKKENKALAAEHKVEGYPTIVVVSPEGKAVARMGYQEGGPTPWIESAEKVLKAAGL